MSRDFSDEEMARDWTLTLGDQQEPGKYGKNYRLFVAIQLCAVRLYGRFLSEAQDLSPRIVNYLNAQLNLPQVLTIRAPERKATYTDQRRNILNYLDFQSFDEAAQARLQTWLEEQARQGFLPAALFEQAEEHLLANRTLLPGPSVLERLIIHVCGEVHAQLFASIYQRLSPALRQAIDQLLAVLKGAQRTYFYQLKEYPPAATRDASLCSA